MVLIPDPSYHWDSNNLRESSTFLKNIKKQCSKIFILCLRCFTDTVCIQRRGSWTIRNTVTLTNDRQLITVDQQIKAYAIRYLTPVRNELATTVCSIRHKTGGFVAAVVVAGTRQNNNLYQEIIFNLIISKHWGWPSRKKKTRFHTKAFRHKRSYLFVSNRH